MHGKRCQKTDTYIGGTKSSEIRKIKSHRNPKNREMVSQKIRQEFRVTSSFITQNNISRSRESTSKNDRKIFWANSKNMVKRDNTESCKCYSQIERNPKRMKHH